MGNCHTVGPNEALVVSGGCCGSDYKQYVFGGWAWAWWCISDTQRDPDSGADLSGPGPVCQAGAGGGSP
ncbi:FLOT2 isoform 7 [Pan troglodytes]|uniref:Flotillin 2 n=3 Tax=Hominidae TaxID=9604 RepID=K7EJ47_HUMAN|nr:flotillin 2 [Homo sapiens]KAI4048611.1 flotillin 2 [Homo sapiens]PNI47025.1 FLOT2 isoform 7 [Pan troglodytes]PNJ34306.1 FLOT2 isoform 7 [Pongo abelii]